jgi:plastocyanin
MRPDFKRGKHVARKEGKGLRRAGIFLALSCLLLVGTIAPAIGASKTVRATEDDRWDPKTQEIFKNDKIIWRNPTDDEHNVKSWGGNWDYRSGELETGEFAEKRFRNRGTFRYRCTYHSFVDDGVCNGMCGKIRVLRPPS